MHDVGKIAIPDDILRKPDPLTPEEREVMQRHTDVGGDLLAGSRSPVVRLGEVIARTHHEHWDGSGYPAGLVGDEIPLAGRITAICDVFDALVTARPYKPAWAVEDALDEIRALSGTQFDPRAGRAVPRAGRERVSPGNGPTSTPLGPSPGTRGAKRVLDAAYRKGPRRRGPIR